MGWVFRAAFVITFGMSVSLESSVTPAASVGESRSAPAKEYACGESGKAPCPLQGWMKTNLAPAAVRGDVDALAKGFDFLASKPPPGYAEWARMAREGAAMARKKDVEA